MVTGIICSRSCCRESSPKDRQEVGAAVIIRPIVPSIIRLKEDYLPKCIERLKRRFSRM
jgi:hypothetical protein